MADYDFTATDRPADADMVDDPDLDDGAGGFVSDLEALAADLASAPALRESVTLEVPGRPGYAVEYRADVSGSELDRWRKKSQDRQAADGVDGVRFAKLVLANTCRAICKDGHAVELTDRSGNTTAATFGSREFQDAIGVRQAGDAVHKLYGRDASIIADAAAVLEASGYSDVARAVDPQ